mgnify:FL=1|jgi:uncharacterized FlgJ-related protein
MTQIQELIKHLGLGIVSVFLFTGIVMANIKNTKDFMKAVEEVRQEYPEDSIERKIPTSFIATVAAAETGNFQFKGAPTAMKANNYFGMHATGDQEFLETIGGAKLRSFPDDKSSIRSFLSLITTDDRYKSVIQSTDKVEEMFKGMSPYAERKDYVNFLSSVYTDRIKPIIETENMLIPKAKPLNQQMNNLQ